MAKLHPNERRHFPLSLVAVRAVKLIASAYLMRPDHEHLVYSDSYAAFPLDTLAKELRADEDATTGARRYEALIFALAVAPMYWTAEECGFFMPMR